MMDVGGQGTLGRRPGPKTTLSVGQTVAAIRRQRSLEWRQDHAGYSSSEDDIPERPDGPAVDSHVFASLLAQAQQFSSDRYRSDDTEDAVTTDNPTSPFPTPPPTLSSPRSPQLQLQRQASPFPLENTNSRRLHYATPQDRLRETRGEVVYSTGNKKQPLPNNTIGRGGRSTGRHRGQGGMTSSSSATSCNSCTDAKSCSDVTYHGDPDARQQQRLCLSNDVNEESPPEPAPPEVPPRGPSLHSATLRRRAEYALPVGETAPSTQESQFLSQDFMMAGSPRTGGSVSYPAPSAPPLTQQHRGYQG